MNLDSTGNIWLCWLGHHEFGLNHKAFNFSPPFKPTYAPESLNYWLEVWLNFYQFAAEIKHNQTYFF
jgi:hypothetical protein